MLLTSNEDYDMHGAAPVIISFFNHVQCEQQQQLEFVGKFSKSKYSSLRQVAQSCVGQ